MKILLLIGTICANTVWTIDEKTCLSELKFEFCKADKSKDNLFWNLYVGQDLLFKILSPGNCFSYGFLYFWELKILSSGKVTNTFKNFIDRAVLTIKSGVLPCNEYNLQVTVKGANQNTKTLNCWFKINTAGPVPIIAGGQHKNAISGDLVIFDGTTTDKSGLEDLKYVWKCTSNPSQSFCSKFTSTKKQTYLTIVGNVGTVYDISLTVSSGKIVTTAHQYVTVIAKLFPLVYISCEKNCRGKGHIDSDTDIILFLKATCFKNCDGVSFLWSVSGDVTEDDTVYGYSDHRLIILPHVLAPDTSYEMTVDAIKNSKPIGATAKWSLRTATKPNKLCTISPKVGTSIKTIFKMECSGPDHPRPVTYMADQSHVTTAGENSGVFLTQNMIPRMSLMLAPEPTNRMVIYFVRDDKYVSEGYELDVNVKPLLSNLKSKDLIEQILKIYNGQTKLTPSVKSLAKRGWSEKAVQIINCLLWEMEYIKPEDLKTAFSHQFKFKLLRDLLMFPSDTGIKGPLTLLPVLIDPTKPKRVHYAVMLSKLCRRLSRSAKLLMFTTTYPLLKIKLAQEYTSILVSCADYLLDGIFERTIGYDITTAWPINIHEVSEEDYPNYKDIIDAQLREKFVDITNNAMDIFRECSYTISLSLAYGELVQTGETNKIYMQLGTTEEIDYGIECDPAVKVELPKNLGVQKGNNIRILFLSLDSNIYFWDEVGKNISTKILDLDIYDNQNNLIHTLPDYIDAYLDVVSNKTPIIPISGKSETWGDSSEWTEFDITVYRIDVRKRSKLFADILNITGEGIQVVMTRNRRPCLKDFNNPTIFKGTGRLHFIPVNYDSWCYIGILPYRTAAIPSVQSSPITSALNLAWRSIRLIGPTTSINYNYIFKTQSCLEWYDGKWTTKDCMLSNKTTTTLIHCRCRGLTAVAGITRVPISKLDHISAVDYKLVFVYTYFIFVMTAAIVLCYFVAICFVLIRTSSFENHIYFLSDNTKDERYAYLVVVKTGTANRSGTSSNIMIQLVGDKRKSKAHVLNYPDPNRVLLQYASEDWFILTTSLHLGELTSIYLWYDALGNRPTWYCESVAICDLQLQKWWSFNVHQWFTVSSCNQHYHKIPVQDQIITKTKSKKPYFLHYFRFYFNADHTWNIFSSTNDSKFSYLERLTTILFHILLTYSLALLICVTPQMKLQDGFNRHFFNSYLRIFGRALGLSLLSSSCTAVFTFCFRNSPRKYASSVNNKMLLPDYAGMLTWIFLICCVVLLLLYLSAFGFWASNLACKVWFMMTTAAILISVFLWDNLYIALILTLEKQIGKSNNNTVYDYEAIIYEAEKQRKSLYEFAGSYGLRPYLVHLYEPLTEERCQKRKKKLLDRLLLSKTLRDMLLFTLYVLCLFILTYKSMDRMAILHNNHMKDMVEAEDAEMPLEEVASLEDIYSYLNDTLLPVIHGLTWYGNWSVIDPGLMGDFNTKVLGVARIRQKRVRPNSCRLTHLARILNVTQCNPELTTATADKRSHGQLVRVYFQPIQTGITITYGQIRTYSGGGYVATLGRNLVNAYYTVERLLTKKWIDKLTRVLFVEFWTYNANQNLFNTVKVVLERSATQYVAQSTEIYTSRLMHVDASSQIIPLMVFTIFLIVIFYQACNCTLGIIYQRLLFFKGFWNILDLIILAFSITLIVTSGYKMEFLDDILDKIERTQKNKFINYYSVVYYDRLITLMSAILICIATLRIWKYLRFGIMFRVFEKTLVKQMRPLMGVFIYNMITLTMFSLAGYLIFSSFSENFKNLDATFTSMMLLSLNFNTENFGLEEMLDYLPNLAYIFYASFTLAMLMIVNVYITVIIIYYEESREYYIEKQFKYSVLDYARDEITFLACYFARYIKNLRLKGGETERKRVTPKNRRYTGAHIVGDWYLRKMAAISAGVVKNFLFVRRKRSLEQIDFQVMVRIAYYTVLDPDKRDKRKHIFFVSEKEGNVKYIPDTRLLQMERILNELLSDRSNVKQKYRTDRLTLERLTNINKVLNIINDVVGNIELVKNKKR
ncbi:Polycystin domain [Popillia japonica]|uniref:Polycystin domain n=1 Tax=Popillia japonica TaxID=7064 RepID=A0AAW1L8K0_POPJA